MVKATSFLVFGFIFRAAWPTWLVKVKKALDLEPQNREAKALVKEVQAAQKEEDKKSKGFFGKMCQALGTGQIPEPYVDRRFEIGDEKDPAKAAE